MNFSNFFSTVQESKWYQEFLRPVVEEVSDHSKLLDIGTGSGKLLQILTKEKNADCTGVDTSESMLAEARIKLKNQSVKLIKIEPDTPLPFETNSFDSISICNVLFHMKEANVHFILNEAKRVLKKGGKIIVLTPTGQKGWLRLTFAFLSWSNRSIYIWYFATKKNATTWLDKGYLPAYAQAQKLNYQHRITLRGFAQVETLQ